MRVISVFNQKGGVGKTTSVVNLAVALNYLDKKVLVVDMDPQANTTTGLGLDKYKVENSLYELFYAGEDDSEPEEQEEKPEEVEETDLDDKEKEDSLKEGEDESKDENQASDQVLKENKKDIDIEDYITKTQSGVDIIASESALSGLEVELVELDALERTRQLKNIVDIIDDDMYDFVLIDCPPSLGLLSINALVASN